MAENNNTDIKVDIQELQTQNKYQQKAIDEIQIAIKGIQRRLAMGAGALFVIFALLEVWRTFSPG